MTANKAQKRAIRSRMAKTGERYTAARHYELELHRSAVATQAPTVEPPLPPRVADPGMSDAAIQRGSGRTWDEWFRLLDRWQATTRTHAEIARYLVEEHGVDGWWAQSVTVGYERARGRRAVHQLTSGFSINASRTVAVPVERLFAAIVDEPSDLLRRRTARPPRSARFDVLEDGSRLSATFIARGPDKSTVQLQHTGLTSSDAVDTWRARWRSYLDQVSARLR